MKLMRLYFFYSYMNIVQNIAYYNLWGNFMSVKVNRVDSQKNHTSYEYLGTRLLVHNPRIALGHVIDKFKYK